MRWIGRVVGLGPDACENSIRDPHIRHRIFRSDRLHYIVARNARILK